MPTKKKPATKKAAKSPKTRGKHDSTKNLEKRVAALENALPRRSESARMADRAFAFAAAMPPAAAAPAGGNIAHGLPPAPFQRLTDSNTRSRVKRIMGAQLHVDPATIGDDDLVLQPGIFAGALLAALNTHFFGPSIPVALGGFVTGEAVFALAIRINQARNPHIPA
jgi:hypothetical protein